MTPEKSDRVKSLETRLNAFVAEHVLPAEAVYHRQLTEGPTRWAIPSIMEDLKKKARGEGLWNLFLPEHDGGAGLTNLEYAPLCEIMGGSPIAPEVLLAYTIHLHVRAAAKLAPANARTP